MRNKSRDWEGEAPAEPFASRASKRLGRSLALPSGLFALLVMIN